MKKLIIAIFFLMAFNITLRAQEEIEIVEKELVEISSGNIVLDGIWILDGELKADISFMRNKWGKPITGGYREGDEISLGDSKYYVKEIRKWGKDERGKIKLSITKPEINKLPLFDEYMIIYPGVKMYFNNLSWNFDSIELNQDKQKIAIFSISNDTNYVSLRIGEILWTGYAAYKVDSLIVDEKDKSQSSFSTRIVLKKVNGYFYNTGIIIPGELINAPIRTDNNYFYIIKFTGLIHCQKGSKNCEKCAEHEKDKKYRLLKLYNNPVTIEAKVFIKYTKNGEEKYYEYDIEKEFKDLDEARKYSIENNVEIIEEE